MSNRRIVVSGVPYRIDEEIGHGLHSTVYSGRDLRNKKPVAIKVISFSHGSMAVRAGTEARQQTFWKELEMLLYLQPLNPYVIRVFNHDYDDHHGIIVMERGKTFRDTLIRHVLAKKPMSASLIRKFWSQMVEAIYYMHRIGIVHGDCKPENFIQVGLRGKKLRLIDMGISFQLPPYVTSYLHTAVGTPDYVSPEMVNSRVGSSGSSTYGYKADVWALGVILFEMAFGYRPLQFLRNNREKLRFLGYLHRDIPIPDHHDKQLRDILKHCLRSNHYERPSIEQLLNHPYLARRH